jgi:hypothetical protein
MNDSSKTIRIPLRKPTPSAAPARAVTLASQPPSPRNGASRRRLILIGGIGAVLTIFLVATAYLALQSDGDDLVEQAAFGAFAKHSAKVATLALSSDGETVVSGDEAGTTLVWNCSTREPIGELAPKFESVRCLTLSLDGKLAAVGDRRGTVRIWEVKNQKPKLEFVAHAGGTSAMIFYPTGKLLITGGADGRVALWDIDERKLLKEAKVEAGEITSLAFYPDGTRFLAGDSLGKVRIWNMGDFREASWLDAHSGATTSIAVSPRGGQALSAGKDGALRRWDLETLQSMGMLPNPANNVCTSVAYSVGATRALVVSEGGGHVVSLEDDRLVESYVGPKGPRGAGVLHPTGTFLIAASPDPAVRMWRTPLPSEIEIQRAQETVAAAKRTGDKLRTFGERIRTARELLDGRREKDAVAEFRRAAQGFSRDSMEYKFAVDMAAEIERNVTALERYAELCKAGKAALEQEEFAVAIDAFRRADAALADAKEAAKYSESKDGLKLALQVQKLKTALEGLKATEQTLDFAESLGADPLAKGKKFAFLLVKKMPPIGLILTPLEYTASFTTPIDFPDEDVSLLMQLFEVGVEASLAETAHPFVAGTQVQDFAGTFAAPETGWKPAKYEVRSSLLVKKEKRELSKQSIEFGLMEWVEKRISVTPAEVQAAEYIVPSDLQVEKGDVLKVSASGSIRPAAPAFYREFMADPSISAPIASPPQGLPWKFQELRIDRYRTIDLKSDFGALIMRVGYDGKWVPYRDPMPLVLAPAKGPMQISINSVIPKAFSYAGTNKPLSAYDKSFWAADSGAFQVVILRGRYDFLTPLTEVQKYGLAVQYFDAKAAKAP